VVRSAEIVVFALKSLRCRFVSAFVEVFNSSVRCCVCVREREPIVCQEHN
jgi:hypothetical protein